ncbi:hypothetical protein D1632_06585 [Chryseobacterium nematophagum]|uniref:Polysaccharide biosynthesis protein n=1 Tax=Chryseobacterium nematophagum TaxID=2305228 RepID=A0A3M7LCW8_9FLAO|nr:oligosaccharide flippase family protein [Chryseobacterium nematophagum]RMZ59306.1 hypothetical protein D1632_06585 [Chryseobacterium nematophagum]
MIVNKLIERFNNPIYKDSVWAIIGNLSLRGLGLLGSIFVARILGSKIFGEYGAIKNTIVSIAIFTTFGLGYTATKYIADLASSRSKQIHQFITKSIKITFILSLTISLFMIILPKIVSEDILKTPHLTNLIRYVSVWVIFNALTTLQIGIISGFGEYKNMAKINTVVGLFTFATSVIFTWFYRLEGAIFSLIISQIFNYFLYYLLLRKIKKKYQFIEESETNDISYKSIINFSLPIALQEMVYSLTSWLLTILIIKFSNFSELGVYTAAIQWSSVVLFIPVVLRNVILSNLSKEKDQKNHNNVIKKMLMLNLVFTLVPIVIIFLFSGTIKNVYGESFSKINSVLYIALFSTIFISLNSVYSQAYMSVGKNWIMFVFRLFRDMTIIGLGIYLMVNDKFLGGAMSMAWATLIANLLFLAFMAVYYHKKLNRYG